MNVTPFMNNSNPGFGASYRRVDIPELKQFGEEFRKLTADNPGEVSILGNKDVGFSIDLHQVGNCDAMKAVAAKLAKFIKGKAEVPTEIKERLEKIFDRIASKKDDGDFLGCAGDCYGFGEYRR